jgi:D-arginine dehydrogenase
MISAADAIIIGGGIAGMSLAWRLGCLGLRTLVLEQEPVVASHSSGRNAAIWLPVDDDPTSPPLARRSAALLDELTQGAWLEPHGGILVAHHPAALDAPSRGAARAGCTTQRIGPDGAAAILPVLAGGAFHDALWVNEAGTLDIHGMTSAVAAAARSRGATIRARAAVERITRIRDRVTGCRLTDGTHLESPLVVNAAGAWARSLGHGCDAALPLTPYRRHLMQLEVEPDIGGATVWHVDDEVYFRRESAGVLASPCDETVDKPGIPAIDRDMLRTLDRKLSALAPGLGDPRVRSSWACLRTFAPDRELVCGPDPRVTGLWWMAGFGGRGMTVGVGAADLTAACMVGQTDAMAPLVDPARLLAGGDQ